MDRRVAALFGGIVAVGLGPAVWLGGTLLRPEPVPAAPTPTGSAEVSPSPTDSASPGLPTPDQSATQPTFAPPGSGPTPAGADAGRHRQTRHADADHPDLGRADHAESVDLVVAVRLVVAAGISAVDDPTAAVRGTIR